MNNVREMICCIFLSFFGVLALGWTTTSEEMSCYECNADLSMGLKEECNDPYAPGPAVDIVKCPRNEPHHCLKAAIYYKNVHATVRGCVPSRSQSSYCSTHDEFAQARIRCKFCNRHACNGSGTSTIPESLVTLIFILVLMSFLIR